MVGKFNYLTVLRTYPSPTRKNTLCDCLCDCGKEVVGLYFSNVKKGGTKSCGCMRGKLIGESHKTHGLSKDPLYPCWKAVVRRCTVPKSKDYERYGGRGIKVCDRWLESDGRGFLNFKEDMGNRPDGFSIDRIDVDGDYEPSNCRWASDDQQRRNKRNSVMLTFNGETKNLTDWADVLGVSRDLLWDRYKVLGWSVEDTLTKPIQ